MTYDGTHGLERDKSLAEVSSDNGNKQQKRCKVHATCKTITPMFNHTVNASQNYENVTDTWHIGGKQSDCGVTKP